MAEHNVGGLDVSVNDKMLVELEHRLEDISEKFFHIELVATIEKITQGFVHPLDYHLEF
jgi:hypothetical protein